MKILVTDGENRSALAVTRSLGKQGHSVQVVAARSKSLASSSRYCLRGIAVPDPQHNGAAFVSAICELSVKEKFDVIFPMTEQSIYLLNSVRDSLPKKTVLGCPPESMMQAVSDKSTLYHLAEDLHIPIPHTIYLTGIDDLNAAIRQIYSYPVVVKPALSKIPSNKGFLSAGVRYASNRHELEQLFATSAVLRYPSLIQEKIVGPGTGLFTLYDRDRHLALFSHKRLREKPPTGGVSVVSESVSLDEEMVEASDRLLSSVGWTGVAMVEFKRDQRDGKAKLMEINGRFWGSLQLAVNCGVDFPGLYLEYLHGKNPGTLVSDYRVACKLKWILGTLDHLISQLKKSTKELDPPQGHPSKMQALLDFLRIWEKNTTYDVFDRMDIGPFAFEVKSYLRYILGKQ